KPKDYQLEILEEIKQINSNEENIENKKEDNIIQQNIDNKIDLYKNNEEVLGPEKLTKVRIALEKNENDLGLDSDFTKKVSYLYSFFIPIWPDSPIFNFIIDLLYIFLHSSIIIHIITYISDKLGISQTFLGMTVIAIGGNIGDTINAVVAAKNDEASLISTSVIGGQIINLQFCLGFPWMMYMLKEKLKGNKNDYINIGDTKKNYNNPMYYFVPLITCVILSVLIITFFNMELNKNVGGCLILIYIFYLLYEGYIQTTN
ncbi:MAG: sodium/calcium exchanger protein, partial [archaeon]|nr:sodium/calcium exchanger protein [archaeon]